ncbi:MAG TPA: hypothetical protein VG755_04960, partial [Nannocystaceae bacterium]|nr:hypothetical protein [Nannocystaceae bacterium]
MTRTTRLRIAMLATVLLLGVTLQWLHARPLAQRRVTPRTSDGEVQRSARVDRRSASAHATPQPQAANPTMLPAG